MKKILQKRWSDILIGIFLLLMLIPQTRQPVQVAIQRMIAFSPKTIEKQDQKQLQSYEMLMQNPSRQTINLSQSKGKVALVNFWATWCPPCIAEMPDFQKLHQDYQNQIDFFFVTQDSWEKVEKFEQKRAYQLPYFQLIQPGKEFNYTQLPTTYLIDKEGNIVLEKTGIASWNSDKFRQTLDQLIAQ
ncbi:MAG: TlpA disulfide reductase family protein [Flavobacteriaceae bacterium]|nr:TlpA disulfide reductase family protein [Flavobacteriaceae bacterium]